MCYELSKNGTILKWYEVSDIRFSHTGPELHLSQQPRNYSILVLPIFLRFSSHIDILWALLAKDEHSKRSGNF